MLRNAFMMLALCAALAGCKGYVPPPPPKTAKVTGKVLLAGGYPLPGGRLIFKPKAEGKQEATAEVGRDGGFSLTSYNKDDGAAPGDYVVVVELTSYASGSLQRINAPVPRKYLDAKTSDLQVTVRDNQEPLVLQLQ